MLSLDSEKVFYSIFVACVAALLDLVLQQCQISLCLFVVRNYVAVYLVNLLAIWYKMIKCVNAMLVNYVLV